MNPQTARFDFERFLLEQLGTRAVPGPQEGFAQLLGYYRTVRAEGCALDQDGDMLLFQWGTWDWGEGPYDEISLTRQLIGASGEDDEIWHLTLQYRFHPATVLAGVSPGNQWCTTPGELGAFETSLREHPVYRALVGRPDGLARLTYGPAG